MLLRRCLRTVNSTRFSLNRLLSADNSDGSTPFSPDNESVTPHNQGVTLDNQGVTLDNQGVTLDNQGVTLDNHDVSIENQGISPEEENKVIKKMHFVTVESQGITIDNQDGTPKEELKEINFVKVSDNLESDNEADGILIQKQLEQDKSRQEMLNNLDSLHELVQKHHSALKQYSLKERPIARENFFNVKSLFTLRDLFDNRVHLGHHIGCWNSANKKYLYGIRNNMHIINIASTEQHLWRALNVVSTIAYSGGSILFVNNRRGYTQIVKEGAKSCHERSWTEAGEIKKYTELNMDWFDKNKPDLVICSSVNNPQSQQLLLHCNKYLVPTIGILDSDVDPTNLTYVIPGNDDSSQSILFYHKVFANAIQRAKKVKQVMQLSDATNSVNDEIR